MSSAEGRQIVLAGEPDFRVGGLDVRPALREVACGERVLTLEPRVMQVLVVLANVPGRVVGRDELIARCWDGRVVGTNAVDRVISRLRRLAAELPQAGFAIETLARVGHRLWLAVEAATPPAGAASTDASSLPPAQRPAPSAMPVPSEPFAMPQSASPTATSAPRRRLIVATAGLAGGAAIGLLGWSWANREPAMARELLRRAHALRLTGGWHDLLEATACLQEATRLAPGSAAAWGALALTQAQFMDLQGDPADAAHFALPTAVVAARALALDTRSADAAVAQAVSKPFYGHWGTFEAGCRAALTRWPGHAVLHDALGRIHSHTGCWANAVAAYRRSLALEPGQACVHARLLTALWASGQDDEAARVAAHAQAAWPESFRVWLSCLRWRLCSGRDQEAKAQIQPARKRPADLLPLPDDLVLVVAQGQADGDAAEKRAAASALLAARGDGRVSSWDAAPLLANLGQVDAALQVLETYYLGGSRPGGATQAPPTPGEMRQTDVLFVPPCRRLRDDARYAHLTGIIGLDAYWRGIGRGPDPTRG